MPDPKTTRLRSPLGLALVALVATACVMPTPPPRGPSDEQIEEKIAVHTEMATGFYALGDYDRAEDQALKGLELEDDNEQLLLILAWTKLRQGKTDDVLVAERIFAELQSTEDFRAVLGLGETMEQKGKAYAAAGTRIESGEQATDAPDPKARAAELTATAHENWTESYEHYRKVLEMHPEDEDAFNGLQRVCALLGRLNESMEWSHKLIEVTDVEITFWQERLARPEITADEEKDFRRFITESTHLQAQTRLQLASVLRRLDRPTDAEAQLSAVLEKEPTRHDVVGRRAQLRFELGQYAAALEDLDAYLRLTPDPYEHPDTQLAYRLRAQCEEKLAAGDPESAGG